MIGCAEHGGQAPDGARRALRNDRTPRPGSTAEEHHATLDAPPLNLIGPEMVRDLVRLVQHLEEHEDEVSVVVFDSASPEFFSAHVDMTRLPALRNELGRLAPDASLWTLYRRISTLKQVTIASIAGRVRGDHSYCASSLPIGTATIVPPSSGAPLHGDVAGRRSTTLPKGVTLA